MAVDAATMAAVDDEDEEVDELQNFMKTGGSDDEAAITVAVINANQLHLDSAVPIPSRKVDENTSHFSASASNEARQESTGSDAETIEPGLHVDCTFLMAAAGQVIHPK